MLQYIVFLYDEFMRPKSHTPMAAEQRHKQYWKISETEFNENVSTPLSRDL
jgi:hypothetical protein